MTTSKTLFQVSNKHVADSGKPPFFDGDTPNRSYSYFQNTFGEQLIYEYTRETRKATLWHGDAGWDQSFNVVDGKAPSLSLSEGEQLWLMACWIETKTTT